MRLAQDLRRIKGGGLQTRCWRAVHLTRDAHFIFKVKEFAEAGIYRLWMPRTGG